MSNEKKAATRFANDYLWRNILFWVLIALPLSLLLYIFALGNMSEDSETQIWVVLLPLCSFPFFLCYWLIRMFFFRRAVAVQEVKYGVTLSYEGAVRVKDGENGGFPATYVYLCEGWLVFPGRAAFYIREIRAIPYRHHVGKGIYYILTVKTADGKKRNFDIPTIEAVRQIRGWYGRGGKCRY